MFFSRFSWLFLAVALLASNSILTPFQAQAQQCYTLGLQGKHDAERRYAVVNEQGQALTPYQYAAVVFLTRDLVRVAEGTDHRNLKWGVVGRQGKLILPVAYDEVSSASCEHIMARQGPATLLYNLQGRELLRDSIVNVHFTAFPAVDRLIVHYRKTPPSRGRIKLVGLQDPGKVYYTGPAQQAQAIAYPLGKGYRLLPFFEVVPPARPAEGVRPEQSLRLVLDRNGRVLFDSITVVNAGPKLIYLWGLRYTIVTDTLLRPISSLSYRYQHVQAMGPHNRWFAVSRQGKSGVIDRDGKVIVPLIHEGSIRYTGRGTFLIYGAQGGVERFLPPAGHPAIELRDYYLSGHNSDTLLAQQPLILKHKKTGKHGLLDPRTGRWVAPLRYQMLAQTREGYIFFQGDSAGYLDRQGGVRLLVPDFELLSPFHEGYAACGKRVSGASRGQYPSAQITYSVGGAGGSSATQYAFIDANGKRISDYFDWVGPFQGGYASVRKNHEAYMIDTKGKPASVGGYVLVSYFGPEGLAVVRQGRLFGLVNREGKLLVPTEYKSIATVGSYPGDHHFVSRVRSDENSLDEVMIPAVRDNLLRVTDREDKAIQVPLPEVKK
ncbi:WG repeat-containing protein [Hymenobacter guriensis]|uniref:WG repeat-containing protein n=1 Tax=Hymenobacter guriensis TaxID=2793065 RepID=A0ABS0L4I6_9BACT|nr:WG repeat-containing protein [Hymenobacter guriensis]MBG8555037.1 WG repeat-containing protein [Hymenobacter guriensis]